MMACRCSCISSTPIRCHDVRMHSGPDWPCDDNKPCAWATHPLSEGDPGAISQKKNRCPISGRPTDLPFSRRFFSPEAQSVTDPPNRFSELPFHSRGRGTPPHPPAPNTQRPPRGKTAKPQSHILTPPFPTTKTPPVNHTHTHTTSRRPTDRPVTALLRQGFPLSSSSRLRLAGWDWPAQPNLRQIGVGLGHLSISSQSPACIGVQPHFFPRCDGKGDGRGARTKKKKVSKRLSRARALVDSLFCCCFCFGLFLLHIPPPFVCFCCCIIVPTLSFSGLDGAAAQRGPTRRGLLLLAGWDDGIYPLFWTRFFDDDGWGGGFNTEQGRGAAAASPYIGFGMTQQQHR